jgi:hypothetical protein
MARYLFTTVALVFLWARPVNAELWCRYGPDSPTLDHSCGDDNDRLVRAVADFHSQRRLEEIPGVLSVGYGINEHGYYPEIEVFVQPESLIPSAAAQVPASINGVPIAVVPPKLVMIDEATSSDCKAGRSDNQADSSYLPVLQEHMQEWNALPGVVGMGAQCKDGCCDFTKLQVSVQAPFVESVRNRIPASIDGVPIRIVTFLELSD